MQLREQRDGDARVAVAGGEALEEAMRDSEELDAAGQSSQRAADAHRADELAVDVDARPLRGARVEAGRAQTQAFHRSVEEEPRRDAGEDRQRQSRVQLAELRQ